MYRETEFLKSYSRVVDQGIAAAKMRVSITESGYPCDSREYCAWMSGWYLGVGAGRMEDGHAG